MDLKKEHPEAKILVHPECRRPLQLIADKVGSTAALLEFAEKDEAPEYIVVTESGILFGCAANAAPSVLSRRLPRIRNASVTNAIT